MAGLAVGELLAGSGLCSRTVSQQRFERQRAIDERSWTDATAAREHSHSERIRRRQELLDVYTRYQVAADRFDNGFRALAASSQRPVREGFEVAQGERDHATERIRLPAPEATAELALNQREASNRLVAAASRGTCDRGTCDDGRARILIAVVSGALLTAMRHGLDGPGEA